MSNDNTASNQREESYHKMVEEVEDYAILMLDAHGIILNWNKGAEKIKGYKEQEIVGKHFRIFYTPEDQLRSLPEILVEEAKEKGKAIHEGWRIRQNGTTFWGSIVITALHDENNKVIGFTKVTRDLTERKAAEDKLLQYARQLESQNRELQQFAYAAAHDMKEPLRKIQFYNSAILEQGREMPEEKQHDYLERAADAAKRMQGLIDDMLAFTRISEKVGQFEPVDLNNVVHEAYHFYHDQTSDMPASFTSSRLPTINGVPFQIRQLFLNLIGNSFKYRHPERALEISIFYALIRDAKGSFHKISVHDNGIGFDMDQAQKIFMMFERLHGREKYPGTGIGLSMCKKIMENHGGHILAKGYPGKGSTFDCYFPASASTSS